MAWQPAVRHVHACVCACLAPPRLICSEDKDYFKAMLYEMLKSKFEVRDEYEALFGAGNEMMFGGCTRAGPARPWLRGPVITLRAARPTAHVPALPM